MLPLFIHMQQHLGVPALPTMEERRGAADAAVPLLVPPPPMVQRFLHWLASANADHTVITDVKVMQLLLGGNSIGEARAAQQRQTGPALDRLRALFDILLAHAQPLDLGKRNFFSKPRVYPGQLTEAVAASLLRRLVDWNRRVVLKRYVLAPVIAPNDIEAQLEVFFEVVMAMCVTNTLVTDYRGIVTPHFAYALDAFQGVTMDRASGGLQLAQYVVVERADVSLSALLASDDNRQRSAIPLIRALSAQVLWTLDVAWRVAEVVHNDLHGQNIMVRLLAEEPQSPYANRDWFYHDHCPQGRPPLVVPARAHRNHFVEIIDLGRMTAAIRLDRGMAARVGMAAQGGSAPLVRLTRETVSPIFTGTRPGRDVYRFGLTLLRWLTACGADVQADTALVEFICALTSFRRLGAMMVAAGAWTKGVPDAATLATGADAAVYRLFYAGECANKPGINVDTKLGALPKKQMWAIMDAPSIYTRVPAAGAALRLPFMASASPGAGVMVGEIHPEDELHYRPALPDDDSEEDTVVLEPAEAEPEPAGKRQKLDALRDFVLFKESLITTT